MSAKNFRFRVIMTHILSVILSLSVRLRATATSQQVSDLQDMTK